MLMLIDNGQPVVVEGRLIRMQACGHHVGGDCGAVRPQMGSLNSGVVLAGSFLRRPDEAPVMMR